MAGGARDGDDDGLITEINVTPLVDVTLVLLIILMVTATQVVSKSIPVELPRAATGQTDAATNQLAISIDRAGKIFLDTREVTAAELRQRAAAAHQRFGAEARATIAADRSVSHGKVIEVIDILRDEEVTKFALNTARPTEEGSAP